MPVTPAVVGRVNPVGVVYFPSSFTVTVSVSTVAPLKVSVNVIVPMGMIPPVRTAESLSVVGALPNVTLAGLGVVTIESRDGKTTTCSEGALISLAALFTASPLYVAFHWYVPAAERASGRVNPVGVL